MRILAKSLFLMAALAAFHAGAQTYSTYSTLGEPGDTYNFNSGWLVNGNANPPQPFVGEAFAFTATASGYLNQLNLAISAGNYNLSIDLANISIAANSSQNLPGATLESFLNVSCAGPLGYELPITSLTSSTAPYLQAGNTYWLCAEAALPNADIVMDQNNLGILSNQAQEFSPSGWHASGNRTTFAFDVELSNAPEPSVATLATLGLAILISRRARNFCSKFSKPCTTGA